MIWYSKSWNDFNNYNFKNVFLFIGNDHKYVINLKDEKKIQMKNDKKHEMNYFFLKIISKKILLINLNQKIMQFETRNKI